MIKYEGFPSYYGKEEWVEIQHLHVYFRNFDPYTGNFKTKENA